MVDLYKEIDFTAEVKENPELERYLKLASRDTLEKIG